MQACAGQIARIRQTIPKDGPGILPYRAGRFFFDNGGVAG